MTRTTTPWGKGKNQVLALKSEIIALLQQGESLESTYQILTDAKKLTIGARTFRRHASPFRQEALDSFSSISFQPKTPDQPSKTWSFSQSAEKSPDKPAPPSIKKPDASSPRPARGFSHKGDGATPDFLQDVYGHPQSPQSKTDQEDLNE